MISGILLRTVIMTCALSCLSATQKLTCATCTTMVIPSNMQPLLITHKAYTASIPIGLLTATTKPCVNALKTCDSVDFSCFAAVHPTRTRHQTLLPQAPATSASPPPSVTILDRSSPEPTS